MSFRKNKMVYEGKFLSIEVMRLVNEGKIELQYYHFYKIKE